MSKIIDNIRRIQARIDIIASMNLKYTYPIIFHNEKILDYLKEIEKSYNKSIIHFVDDELLSCEDFNKDTNDYVTMDIGFKLVSQNLCKKCVERESSQ